MLCMTMIIVILTAIIGKKGATPMPLYNRLKEYRARLGVNQQEMGTLVGGKPSVRSNAGTTLPRSHWP